MEFMLLALVILAAPYVLSIIGLAQVSALSKKIVNLEKQLKTLQPNTTPTNNNIEIENKPKITEFEKNTETNKTTSIPIVVEKSAPELNQIQTKPINKSEPLASAPDVQERPHFSLSDWLSEKGLVWIGGLVLTLGGLFLVVMAAERGFFGPPVRIGAGVALGAGLILASFWMRTTRLIQHPLAGAVCAGAGAAILYGCAWASNQLYNFITPTQAFFGYAAISLSLFVMAHRHGQPLALMAIIGAYLAPNIVSSSQISPLILWPYLCMIGFTAALISGRRNWIFAMMLNLAAGYLFSFQRAETDFLKDTILSLAIEAAPAAVALASALGWLSGLALQKIWNREPEKTKIFIFAAVHCLTFITAALSLTNQVLQGGAPFLTCGALILTSGMLFILSVPLMGRIIAGISALTLALLSIHSTLPLLESNQAWKASILVGLLLLQGLMANFLFKPTNESELEAELAKLNTIPANSDKEVHRNLFILSKFGTQIAPLLILSVCVMASYAANIQNNKIAIYSLFGALSSLIIGIAISFKNKHKLHKIDSTVYLWAATTGIIFSAYKGLEPNFYIISVCLIIASLSVIQRLLVKITLSASLLSSCGILILSLLQHGPVTEALNGTTDPSRQTFWVMTGLVMLALVTLALCARLLRPQKAISETFSTAAWVNLALLIYLLLSALPLWLKGVTKETVTLDPLLLHSLRGLSMLFVGYISLNPHAESRLARFRGPIFIAAGLAYAATFMAALAHPWWGTIHGQIQNLPVLNVYSLAYLPTGILLFISASKLRQMQGMPMEAARIVRGSGIASLLIWAVTMIRHLFHPKSMVGGIDTILSAESAAYAVGILALVAAQALLFTKRKNSAQSDNTSMQAESEPSLILLPFALIFASFTFGYWASPWWGPHNGNFDSWTNLAIHLGLYLAGLLISAWIAFGDKTKAFSGNSLTKPVTMLIGFSLLTLLIRTAFHGLSIDVPLKEESIETWTYSALWALYGVCVLALGATIKEKPLTLSGLVILLSTTAKVFFFDLSRLDGIPRAASFLVLGLLLIGAAVLVRRLRLLNGTQSSPNPPEPGPDRP